LSARKVNYADQGTFSFAFWPFSLKLLWAPLVDSIFIKKLGRRKTWLIPVQYLLGIYMIIWSSYVRNILNDEKSSTPGIICYQIILKDIIVNYFSIIEKEITIFLN
jgi:PAT family acetyl-CoA transporter-like MFS transporter 1